MRNKFLLLFGAILMSSAGLSFAAGDEHHMRDRDTQRWSHEDTTPAARYQSMKREANAAYRDALASCRSMRRHEKMECTREAKHNYQADLEYAKRMRER